jgi:hypothetical protein
MGLRASMMCSLIAGTLAATPSAALVPFSFSTGDPDGKMASASRPDGGAGKIEIESADDFVFYSICRARSSGLVETCNEQEPCPVGVRSTARF